MLSQDMVLRVGRGFLARTWPVATQVRALLVEGREERRAMQQYLRACGLPAVGTVGNGVGG